MKLSIRLFLLVQFYSAYPVKVATVELDSSDKDLYDDGFENQLFPKLKSLESLLESYAFLHRKKRFQNDGNVFEPLEKHSPLKIVVKPKGKLTTDGNAKEKRNAIIALEHREQEKNSKTSRNNGNNSSRASKQMDTILTLLKKLDDIQKIRYRTISNSTIASTNEKIESRAIQMLDTIGDQDSSVFLTPESTEMSSSVEIFVPDRITYIVASTPKTPIDTSSISISSIDGSSSSSLDTAFSTSTIPSPLSRIVTQLPFNSYASTDVDVSTDGGSTSLVTDNSQIIEVAEFSTLFPMETTTLNVSQNSQIMSNRTGFLSHVTDYFDRRPWAFGVLIGFHMALLIFVCIWLVMFFHREIASTEVDDFEFLDLHNKSTMTDTELLRELVCRTPILEQRERDKVDIFGIVSSPDSRKIDNMLTKKDWSKSYYTAGGKPGHDEEEHERHLDTTLNLDVTGNWSKSPKRIITTHSPISASEQSIRNDILHYAKKLNSFSISDKFKKLGM